MQYLLLREKYLELLEQGQEMAALQCLRHELVPLPLHHADKDIQTLTRSLSLSLSDNHILHQLNLSLSLAVVT